MIETDHTVKELTSNDIDTHLDNLCWVLMDAVRDGAAISFMDTMTPADAVQFWLERVKPSLLSGERRLLAAFKGRDLVGCVQIIVGMPPNQPHRAEISKMVVHPVARRRGIATALMRGALHLAKEAGKTLVTLDTRTGDVSQVLYRRVGFEEAGVIPDYAYDPDGCQRHATTYMYRYI